MSDWTDASLAAAAGVDDGKVGPPPAVLLTGAMTPSPQRVHRRVPSKQQQQQQQQQQQSRLDACEMADVVALSCDGRRVEPWEEAYFNGGGPSAGSTSMPGTVLEEIPVRGRGDNVEQVAFRPNQPPVSKVKWEKNNSLC